MIITQPVPQAMLIEWIKKQKEDLRSQGFGGSSNHANQTTLVVSDESTCS